MEARPETAPAPVAVVSGLPRSGTSMMMRMLEAGGFPILQDGVRAADEDNPYGYFEFDRTKRLREDKGWVASAAGKAVKVVSFLLPELPAGFSYQVIFIRRPLDEVLASQRRMLERRGESRGPDDMRMKELYERHLRALPDWLDSREGFETLYMDYGSVLAAPEIAADRVNAFLGGGLDAAAMAAAVDTALHRQRSGHDIPQNGYTT